MIIRATWLAGWLAGCSVMDQVVHAVSLCIPILSQDAQNVFA